MLDKHWTWTYSGQSMDLGCALAVAQCPPTDYWTNIRQTLDMDIFWTKVGRKLCIASGPVPAHCLPNICPLDKIWTNNGLTIYKL